MILIYIISQYIDKDTKEKDGKLRKKREIQKKRFKTWIVSIDSRIVSDRYTKINKHGANW